LALPCESSREKIKIVNAKSSNQLVVVLHVLLIYIFWK
jgi:hypothetical protein